MATWQKVVTESSSGVISQKAANVSDADFGDITVSSGSWTIDNNVVDASALNVSGNGTSGQSLTSNGSGGFSWTSIDTATNLDVSNFAGSAIQLSTETFADNDTSLMTSAAIADKIEAYGYGAGDITGVTIACDTNSVADGSENVNFTLAGGTGISTTANSANGTMTINVNSQLADIAGMTEAETTALASISETTFNTLHGRGSSELQSLNGLNADDDGILVNESEGTTSGHIKVTTFTSVKNVLDDEYWNFAHTSGIRVSGGDCAFDNDVVITGNLTVNGTQTVLNTETISLDDNAIVLNSNSPATPAADAGIVIERGDSTNEAFYWDESADRWAVGDGESGTTGETTFSTDANVATIVVAGTTSTPNGDSEGVGSFYITSGGDLYLRTA